MNFLNQYNLKTKLLFSIVIISFLGFATTLSILTFKTTDLLKDQILNESKQLAHRYSNQIQGQLEVPMDSARTLAHVLQGLKGTTNVPLVRAKIESALISMLENNPSFFGVWTGWEPNAFDGEDAKFVNTKSSDQTGRFLPYVHRNEQGQIAIEAITDYEQSGVGDFYQLPKKLKQEMLLNPYYYKVNGKDVLMTSVVVPIIVNNQVIGVVGVDIALDYLYEEFKNSKPFNEGYMYIMSKDYKLVFHSMKELIGKHLDEVKTVNKAERDYIADAVKNDKDIDFLTPEKLRVHVPLSCGKSPMKWSLSIVVPRSYINNKVNEIIIFSSILGLLSIIALVMSMKFIMQRFVYSPLQEINHTFKKLTDTGDFTIRAKVVTDKDEFGQTTIMLNDFIQAVHKNILTTNDVMKAVANGDFSNRFSIHENSIGDKGDLKLMKEYMNSALNKLSQIMNELNKITDSIVQGNFKTRVSSEVGGTFKINVDSAMQSMELILNDINQVMNYVAKGELHHRINVTAHGDLNILKQNINNSLVTISEVILQLNMVIPALSSGDLRTRIDNTHMLGEFQELTFALNDSLNSITNLIKNISNTAISITDGTREISEGNLNLADRTSEQASSLEETSASMDTLTETVASNTKKSQEANDFVQNSVEIAEKGGKIVDDVIHTMNDISTSSRRINDIISIIDSIAFQTNILALNAAVEAARAGEQGRGFAVVASEVRNLAQRSSSASKDIRNLILESVNKVEDGSKLVQEAGKTMEIIVNAIKQVTVLMEDISVSSIEQSNGISQIKIAVDRMNSITQQNSSLVEEISATSSSLDNQAQNLLNSIKAFKM